MTIEEKDKVRLDKWLWSVRVFKTRSQATEACRKGRISVNGTEAKASREIRTGDMVFIRKLPVVFTLRVKALVENRLPARRVQEFAEDLTGPEELEKLQLKDMAFFQRERGLGRPTKKERRLLDQIMNQD